MDPEAWSVVDIERPSASASPSLWRLVNSVLSMAYADCLLKKLQLNKVLLDLKGSSTLAGWKLDASPVVCRAASQILKLHLRFGQSWRAVAVSHCLDKLQGN